MTSARPTTSPRSTGARCRPPGCGRGCATCARPATHHLRGHGPRRRAAEVHGRGRRPHRRDRRRRLRRREDGRACAPTAPRSPWTARSSRFSNNKGNEIWGTEYFRIAKGTPGPTGPDGLETDLFAGLAVTRVSDSLGGKVAGLTMLGLLGIIGGLWVGVYLYAGDEAPRNAAGRGGQHRGPGARRSREEAARRAGVEDRRADRRSATATGASSTVDPGQAGPEHRLPRLDRGGRRRRRASARGAMWQVVTGGGDHHAEVAVDQSKMQAALDELSSGIGQRPWRATSSSGTAGRPGLRRARPASSPRGATQALLEQRFLHGGSQKLPTRGQEPEVSDADVRDGARGVRQARRCPAPVTLVLAGQRVVAPPAAVRRGPLDGARGTASWCRGSTAS